MSTRGDARRARDLVARCRAEIDRLRSLADNDVTPGPWQVLSDCPEGEHVPDWDIIWVANPDRATVATLAERYTAAPRDAALIVASVNLFPAFLQMCTDILDDHKPEQDHLDGYGGLQCSCNEFGPFPCLTVEGVVVALGVGEDHRIRP